jgi:hypothetical protein
MQDKIAEALNESLVALQLSLDGMSDADAAHKPGPNRWCALDCVEHLVISERALLARIAAAEPAEGLPEDPAREARATNAVASRSRRIEAPERAHPTGRFTTVAQALRQFETARHDTERFASEHAEDLARRTPMHPLLGALTGIEMILVIGAHTRRHAEQIRELRALRGLGFDSHRLR